MRPNHYFIKIFLIIFSLCPCLTSFGQSTDVANRIKVLQSNIAGKKYVFNYSKKGDHDETQLIYLGILKTNNGRQFKILSCCWIWGKSKRATNRILVYTFKNEYLGNYHLDTRNEFPVNIVSNQLVFKIPDDGPSKVITTKIPFTKGIPQSIAITGDNVYPFERD